MAWNWKKGLRGAPFGIPGFIYGALGGPEWFNKQMYGESPSGDPNQYPEAPGTDYGPMKEALLAEIGRTGEKQRGDIVQGMANRGIWKSNVPEMGPLKEQRQGEQEMTTKVVAEMMMREQQEKNQDWLRRQGWAREDVQAWEANRAATRAALWGILGKGISTIPSFFA